MDSHPTLFNFFLEKVQGDLQVMEVSSVETLNLK